MSKKIVKLRAKVQDIPESFVIDISELETGKTFYVKDLKFDKGTFITPPRTALFGVGTGRKEEEFATPAAAAPAAAAYIAGQNIKKGDEIIGHRMSIKAVKNKVASPYKMTVVDLIYGVGIDKEKDFLEYATNIGALTKAGAWYRFKGENVGNGFDATVLAIKNDPELFTKIKAEVASIRAAKAEELKPEV